MQYETELFGSRSMQVFMNHASVRVARALRDVMTADERKLNWRVVRFGRGRYRSTDAACVASFIDESIPILATRLQASRQESTRPVRLCGDVDLAGGRDV